LSGYKNKVRIRVCGLLIEDDSLLLVELLSPITNKYIWTPPGGGVEFGESLERTVEREFQEETGIVVHPKELMHINELITKDFHAVEFFYKVERVSGELKLGSDPERKSIDQIIKNATFLSKNEIQKLDVAPVYIKESFWQDILN